MYARRLPLWLCSRCASRLQKRRFYATQSGVKALTVPVLNRAFISLKGADAVPFLQGLTTRNIATEYDKIRNNSGNDSPSQNIYTAFLNAQGRVLNDAFLWPPRSDVEDWKIEVDGNEVHRLFAHLKKHKLRSKVELKLPDEKEMPTVLSEIMSDPSEADIFERSDMLKSMEGMSSILPQVAEIEYNTADSRPHMRRRILQDPQLKFKLLLKHGSPTSTWNFIYTYHRFCHGLPEGQTDILRETALPLETNLDLLGAIDFRKGCYLGQELTIRTHHTGVVRKRILPVQLYPFDELSPSLETPFPVPNIRGVDNQMKVLVPQNAQISKVGASRGRSVGKLLGNVGNIGLALCRLEMMTDIRLTGEASQYDPNQEFMVNLGEGKDQKPWKVRAFVPDWMRQGIADGLRSHSREQEPDLEKNIESDVPGTDEELTSPHGAFGMSTERT
ncbi:MAG: hypothetical protein Q9227_009250 [Pyrenula ochraceoflavens]